MKYIPMNFINALNSALNKNSKLRVSKSFKTSNPNDFDFLEVKEVLYKLSNSDKEDIKKLINNVWEVEEFIIKR